MKRYEILKYKFTITLSYNMDNKYLDKANKYFTPKLTDRERAAFEAGVALGMILHQFRGIPIKYADEVEHLRKVIEYAVMSQPFKQNARVQINIDTSKLNVNDPYSYVTLDPKYLDVEVIVEYGRAFVKAKIRYIDEINYTLAYIEDIGEK